MEYRRRHPHRRRVRHTVILSSPVSNPNLIYAGGKDNGASSGVLKSVDMGRHWKLSSHGMFNTAIESLYIRDDKGDHLFCGTDGGIYESTDAAASWTLIKETQAFGVCKAIVNGTIAGVPTILAGCEGGVANRPSAGGNWSLIKSPPGVAAWRSNYLSVSDALGSTSVVAGCLWPDHVSGVVTIGTLLNTTHANWTLYKRCMAARPWPSTLTITTASLSTITATAFMRTNALSTSPLTAASPAII